MALKTAGLLAAMAQAGLHIPADKGSRLPVFQSLFADIGDEQSISASLSTFSAHITNVVSMDRDLALPALVLLDEVGAGTDPVEGGALGTAVIDHFRQRGAHLVATTHYDSLKSYASTTEGVVERRVRVQSRDVRADLPAGLRLARAQPGDRDRRAARHAGGGHRGGAREPDRAREAARRAPRARGRRPARARAGAAGRSTQERMARRRSRAEAARARGSRCASARRRCDAGSTPRLDEQLRDARREIDAVIEGLKARAAELSEQAAVRLQPARRLRAAGISTGETGAARADARAGARRTVVERLQGRRAGRRCAVGPSRSGGAAGTDRAGRRASRSARSASKARHRGARQARGGRRARQAAARRAARPARRSAGAAGGADACSVNVDLQPREGLAVRAERHRLHRGRGARRGSRSSSTRRRVTDLRELRIVHGHGTGQLRRAIAAFLKDHPLVAQLRARAAEPGRRRASTRLAARSRRTRCPLSPWRSSPSSSSTT